MFPIDPVTVLVSIVVILFLANVYNNQRQQKGKNLPPGPRPLPIIGSMHLMDMRKPHKTFIELSKKYGPVFTIHLGMSKMVILCGYDAVKEALVNQADEFADRPRTPLFYKVHKDNGIVFSSGENWKAMRRFTLSALRDYGMGKKAIEDKINEEAECLVKTFKSYKGKPFNNQLILNAAVANIIVSMLLDRRFDYEDSTLLKLMSLINESVRLAGHPMARLYNMIPRLIEPLPGGHRKIFENASELKQFMRDTFMKRRDDLDVNDQRNIIDAYLVKQQEGRPESTLYFHDDNLTSLVTQLFGAGMETTSTTLRWALLLMMKYPAVQKKVHDEINRVIGMASPKMEHKKQMPYTEAVLCEIQRFGDIVPANVPHATSQDVTLMGYDIPKGTTVIPLLASVLRDEAYFEKPYEFYPEHFLDADGNFKKNEAFIPFSAGKRSCAGENLANMELFLFFTTLLQNFTFQAPPGAVLDLTPTVGSTNAPIPYQICATAPLGNNEDMFPIEPVTVLVSLSVILFLANVYIKQKQQKGKNLPPGPRPLPIIGSMHLVDMRKPYKSFIQLSKKYGPIFTIHLGTMKMVVLCGYDVLNEALVNQADEFADRPKIPLFYKVQKDYGIVLSSGESWKAMRKFTISALRDYGMGRKALEDKVIEEAECLVQTLRSYRGKPFNNQTILNAAVTNIIASMLMDKRFDYDDPTLLKLMHLINEYVRLLGEPMAQLYNMFPTIIDLLPGVHNKMNANVQEVYRFMRETFTKQRQKLDVNDQRNIIDAYLVKQQEGKSESTLYYNDDNLTALISQLFVAGLETTSTTLRWGLLLMIKYPEVQRKVQSEIDRVIGTASPTQEHKKEMPYTEAVLCEVQRFGDVVPNNVLHLTTQDVTLRGYFIPKGTTIMPVLSSALRDEAYFEKPYEFYPEHFLDADGNFRNNEAFIPFSAGRRSCAGETLAKMELFLFFTTLLQNFTFQAPSGVDVDLTSEVSFTNAPLPHEVCALPRN
ncbi:uncharacterized protein [Hyperolius riggenbachi]|uniref:uncharacterized protein n=1 Tax=Hyperolius riggenbachi TaxID=752182 RepID=UPI0035A33264